MKYIVRTSRTAFNGKHLHYVPYNIVKYCYNYIKYPLNNTVCNNEKRVISTNLKNKFISLDMKCMNRTKTDKF